MMTYKIFINCDGNAFFILDDIRLARRLLRDTT
jgi:uridine kinase